MAGIITIVEEPKFIHGINDSITLFNDTENELVEYKIVFDIAGNDKFINKIPTISGETIYYNYVNFKNIIKNKIYFNPNPSSSNINKIDNNYILNFVDFNSTGYTDYKITTRAQKLDIDKYLNNVFKPLLTTSQNNNKIYCDTEKTYRVFNGQLNNSGTKNFDWDHQIIDFYNGDTKVLSYKINNQYKNLSFQDNKIIVEIPAGIPNIIESNMELVGFLDIDNIWKTNIPTEYQNENLPFSIDECCDLMYSLIIEPESCNCTEMGAECINIHNNDPSDCESDPFEFGCSNSPYTETMCIDRNTGKACTDDTPNEDRMCVDVINNDPCISDDPADTTCVYDSVLGLFVGNVSGSRCHSQYRDWIRCSPIPAIWTDYIIKQKDFNYKIYLENSSNTRVSEIYNFNIIEKNRFDGINILWENSMGGVDSFLFRYLDEKSYNIKNDIYTFTNYEINENSIDEKSFHKESLILSKKYDTIIEVNTGFINQDEIDGLNDLFLSTEVYLKYKNEWFYVLDTTKKSVIYNKKNKGFKNYKILFKLSKKNYR